jgi:hypothetical protein
VAKPYQMSRTFDPGLRQDRIALSRSCISMISNVLRRVEEVAAGRENASAEARCEGVVRQAVRDTADAVHELNV